ncbi:unnamed protein product [Darwinula stevensoni]|uniref:Uncharacterized protein n=1 Tax=Darwinula stevensoni TaxID=69355 RepID=A0A7R9AGP2_9CRUS|nr:unnamed protein product [Darwinula stevensoni]CAG0904189.1 unnamed protein product [Darwinula stevensoni]
MKFFDVVVFVLSFPIGYEGNEIGNLVKKMRRFDHLGKDLKLSGMLEIFLEEPNIQECIWKCDINEHKGRGCDGVNYNPELRECELVASGSSGLILDRGWLAYSSLHHQPSYFLPNDGIERLNKQYIGEFVLHIYAKETQSFPFTMKFFDFVVFVFSFPIGYEGNEIGNLEPNIQECIWKCDINEHKGRGCDGVNYNPELGECELVASGSSGLILDRGWLAYSSLHHRKFQKLAEWVEASNGKYPVGALEGGKTSSGEKIYVGRTKHDSDILPCKLHPSHSACYAPYGGKEMEKKTYEVLVNGTERYLDWVAASGVSVPDGALLGGRTAMGLPLFICRCMHEKDFVCGKASRDLQFHPGLVPTPGIGKGGRVKRKSLSFVALISAFTQSYLDPREFYSRGLGLRGRIERQPKRMLGCEN